MRRLKHLITLVTEAQAIEGNRFSIKIHNKCKKCKLYNVCIGKLREGLVYEVVKIRRITHECPLIKTKMVVVEVVEAPKLIGLTSKVLTRGLILSYKPIKCNERSCPNYKYCVPKGFKEGEKVVIENVIKRTLKCPKGLSIKLVAVRRLTAFEELH